MYICLYVFECVHVILACIARRHGYRLRVVRYGDCAPKSIPARLLGLVWMFGGIVMMSIFTATLTAAITADTQQEFVLKGAKVVTPPPQPLTPPPQPLTPQPPPRPLTLPPPHQPLTLLPPPRPLTLPPPPQPLPLTLHRNPYSPTPILALHSPTPTSTHSA